MALLERIADSHTAAEFRRTARLRYAEAERAGKAGDRLIAVYLAGYAAEMTLKSAYFRVAGKGPDDPIDFTDLQAAKARYKFLLGVSWPGNLHRLAPWLELLAAERRAQGRPISTGLASRAADQVNRIAANWREDLRYHRNRPRVGEVVATFRAVLWLSDNEVRFVR